MKNKFLISCLSFFLLCFLFSCAKEDTKKNSAKEMNASDGEGIPVEALRVTRKPVEQTIRLTGVIEPKHSVDIIAEVSGKILKINKLEGDSVTTDDILALIDDKVPLGQYRQAQSQVLSAENNLKIAQLNLKSDKELLENGDISKIAYETSLLAVKTAEAERLAALANLSLVEKTYNDTKVRSPFPGLVARKYADIGSMITPSMPVYRVVDIRSVKIEVGIPQTVISRVSIGSKADVVISPLNNRTFFGTVEVISPQADEKSGSFTAEVHVKNTEEMIIRAGMTAKVVLKVVDKEQHLVIPEKAVVNKGGLKHVYRIKDGLAELSEISLSETIGNSVIIANGIEDGDTIVVKGMNDLGVKTRIKIKTVHQEM